MYRISRDIEKLNEKLIEQVHARQESEIYEILKEWDKLYGIMPTFQSFVLKRLQDKWLEWVAKN